MVAETVIGGLLGGLLRLAPEFFKWLDRRSERGHELAMQDKALEFARLQGDQRLSEIRAEAQGEWNVKSLSALTSAIQAQGHMSGVKWVDAVNTLIRPVLALWWGVVLYTAVLMARFYMLSTSGTPTADALLLLWGPDEAAIAGGVINFFILNRVFDKVR